MTLFTIVFFYEVYEPPHNFGGHIVRVTQSVAFQVRLSMWRWTRCWIEWRKLCTRILDAVKIKIHWKMVGKLSEKRGKTGKTMENMGNWCLLNRSLQLREYLISSGTSSKWIGTCFKKMSIISCSCKHTMPIYSYIIFIYNYSSMDLAAMFQYVQLVYRSLGTSLARTRNNLTHQGYGCPVHAARLSGE